MNIYGNNSKIGYEEEALEDIIGSEKPKNSGASYEKSMKKSKKKSKKGKKTQKNKVAKERLDDDTPKIHNCSAVQEELPKKE